MESAPLIATCSDDCSGDCSGDYIVYAVIDDPSHRVNTILITKGIITAEDIRTTVSKLESFSDQLWGADLVVKAWMDDEFIQRLSTQ